MNYLLRHCSIGMVLGGLLASVPVQAQEFRIGFVNTDRIFKEASTAKAAQAKLEQEFSRREKELVDQGVALKTMADKFEREAPTLPEGQRASRQKQLVDLTALDPLSAEYVHLITECTKLAMADREPGFASSVQQGDLLVGGRNFGYGHPHYPAMRAMRHLGIAGVVAESFSPGFFRGEISMGFPLATCPGILAAAKRGDEIEVDWAAGQVRHLGNGQVLPLQPLSAAERQTLQAGGLVPYLKQRLALLSGAQP